MALAVIAGLGNPGSRYTNTRHNLGAIVVEQLAKQLDLAWKHDRSNSCHTAKGQFDGRAVILLKPALYMNESGQAIAAFARYHRVAPEDVAVVYDDITLELGRIRITQRGSAGGHNGVFDILQHLGSGFIRYRLGIGGKPHPEMNLTDWVLGRFTEEELALVQERLPHIMDGLKLMWSEGVEQAMNQFNQRNSTIQKHDTDSNTTPLPGDLHP